MAVRGHWHQGNISYGGGTHCTLMALTALIFALYVVSPNDWGAGTVDSVLFAGDNVYSHTVDTYFNGDHSRLFGHDEIPTDVDVLGIRYHTRVLETQFGIVGHLGNDDVLTVSIEQAILTTFSLSQYTLATFNSESVAIFGSESLFYIFDSHARDMNGYADSDGNAILLSFSSREQLVAHLNTRYNNAEFNLSPVIITLSSEHTADQHHSVNMQNVDNSGSLANTRITYHRSALLSETEHHDMIVNSSVMTRSLSSSSEYTADQHHSVT